MPSEGTVPRSGISDEPNSDPPYAPECQLRSSIAIDAYGHQGPAVPLYVSDENTAAGEAHAAGSVYLSHVFQAG